MPANSYARPRIHDEKVHEDLGAAALMQAEADGKAVPYEATLAEVCVRPEIA